MHTQRTAFALNYSPPKGVNPISYAQLIRTCLYIYSIRIMPLVKPVLSSYPAVCDSWHYNIPS